jgi:hypothetical protein
MFFKKKKKTKVITTTTTTNTVVKLSYLQTLALTNSLASIDALETESYSKDLGGSSSKKYSGPTNFLGTKLNSVLNPFGAILNPFKNVFGSTKVKVKNEYETSGGKIKDQWLQPEFDRIRYAIGIKELTASAYKFAAKSEFVSVPFLSPKEIIKVYLIVDQYIPSQFDSNQTWIEYYVKPDGENKWIRVNPLNNPTKFNKDGDIIPKIINYNIPKPTTAQLEDKYLDTPEPVKKFRVRAVLSRPEGGNNDSITPLLKSYRLVMTPRD